MDREPLAALLAADLDAILDQTRAAYLARVPRLHALPSDAVEDVVGATRRALRSFLRYYVEGTLDADSWRLVRDATIDRADEVFTREEILEFVGIARHVTADVVHHLTELHPDLDAVERAQVADAMDRYVAELAEQEDRLRQLVVPATLDEVLGRLEAEGADLQ